MTLTADTPQRTDVERFSDILAAQRAAYLRDGAPPLATRRSDLKKFKAALLARRGDIEEAINTNSSQIFRSRHPVWVITSRQ